MLQPAMLQDLGWPTLEKRRWSLKTIILFKILHSMVCIPANHQWAVHYHWSYRETPAKIEMVATFFMLMLLFTLFFHLDSYNWHMKQVNYLIM